MIFKKFYFLLLFFCGLVLCTLQGFAENVENPLKGLTLAQHEQLIKKSTNRDTVFKLLTRKARFMSLKNYDPKKIHKLCDSLLMLPAANKAPEQTIVLYRIKSRLHFSFPNELDKAKIYAEKALNLLATLPRTDEHQKQEIKIRSNIATILGAQGFPEKQQKICFELIPLAKELKDSVNLGNIYRNIAIIYINRAGIDNIKKSISYLQLFEHYRPNISPNDEDFAKIDEIYCSIYIGQNDIKNLTKAIEKFKKKEKFLPLNSPYLASLYWAEGTLATLEKNYTKAVDKFSISIDLAKKSNNVMTYTNSLNNKLNALLELKDWKKAAEILELLRLSTLNSPNNQNLNYYIYGAKFHEFQHNYKKAYAFLEQYAVKADSLNALQITDKLHVLEQHFSVEQKEQEIKLLEIENERKNILLHKNKIISYFLMFIILCIIVGLFMYIRSKDREKLLQENQIKLLTLEMEAQKQNNTIGRMNLMKSIEENERMRIANDLHDGLSGLLSGLKIAIQKLKITYNYPLLVQKFDELSTNIDDTKDELKRIVYSLSPKIIEKYGVIEGLKQYCKKLNQPNFTIKLQVIDFNDTISLDNQIMMFRLIQEMLNNVIKHAHASQTIVQIQSIKDQCLITVEDNGRGYDQQLETSKLGMGLKSIQERVKALNGTLEVDSKLNEGTSIYISCYPY